MFTLRRTNSMALYNERKKKKKPAAKEPFNLDAERAVLGSAFLSNAAVLTILSSLNQDDFYEAKHQIIYQAIQNLYDKKSGVDFVTVTEELQNMKELEHVGGPAYLSECADAMVALSHLEYYIGIVNDQSVLRKMLNAIRDIDNAYLYNEIEDVNDFIIKSEIEFKDSLARRKVAAISSVADVAKVVRKQIDEAKEREVNPDDRSLIGLTTGFRKLNDITLGFQPGQLIVLAGRPGLGKTALAINFAYKASRQTGKPVLFFSLEMSNEEIARRLIACESRIDMTKIITGDTTEQMNRAINSAIDAISNTKFYIDDTAGSTLTDITAKSKKFISTNPDLGLIVIDYLGKINYSTSNKSQISRQEEVSRIVNGLKNLARELKVPVLVLSQFNRTVEQRESHRPQMSDLRESGSIEQEADVIFLMYRPDYNDEDKKGKKDYHSEKKSAAYLSEKEKLEFSRSQRGKELLSELEGNVSYVEVNVAKNRQGRTDRAGLFFYKAFGRFDEPSPDWEAQMLEITKDDGID